MQDRNTVIDAFDRCLCRDNNRCPGCYQEGPGFGYACRESLCRDVLDILRTERSGPVRITWKCGKAYCGACGKRIPQKIKARYCHKCGTEIQWS